VRIKCCYLSNEISEYMVSVAGHSSSVPEMQPRELVRRK
jgi:hypothetical protein